MKKSLILIVFLFYFSISYAQSKPQLNPNPISLLDSITSILNFVTFWGWCEIGDARGESKFDLTTIKNKPSKIGVTYMALGYKATETGILKNFKYTNDGPYNTKKLTANWVNTQPQNGGSGEFLLTFYGDERPNTLYIEIRGGSWVYYLVEKLTDDQFNRIKKIMAAPQKNNSINEKKSSKTFIKPKNIKLPKLSDRSNLERISPIGWSKDGKFAYIEQGPPFESSIDCINFYIQDMVTDKTICFLTSNNFNTELIDNNFYDSIWNELKFQIVEKLNENNIEQLENFQIMPLPMVKKEKRIGININNKKKAINKVFGDTYGDLCIYESSLQLKINN